MRVSKLIVAALLAVGCGQTAGTVDGSLDALNGPFVAVPKALSDDTTSAVSQAVGTKTLPADVISKDNSFYIAIHKDQLGTKWFYSAYLTQLFPRIDPASTSLGTRVVSFKVQNGKLFVFDVDDRKATSDSANPEVIVEAFPIVDGGKLFKSKPNAKNYIVFDPAAGLNRFNFVADWFSNPWAGSQFKVDLLFSQKFHALKDGVGFEQIFTGSSQVPDLSSDGTIEYNAFRFSGSIGVTLREYSEGEGYEPMPLPEQEFYFRSDAKLVRNESRTEQTAAHWNINPARRPIEFVISRDALKIQADERFKDYDVVNIIKTGVENWNEAFGFTAVTARLAEEDESAGHDDVNFIHVDFDNAFGYAFANWRSNPNTGETRGASVYFSSMWFEIANEIYTDDEAAQKRTPNFPNLKRPAFTRLTSDSLGGGELCLRHPADAIDQMAEMNVVSADRGTKLTKKEKVERYLSGVILHEVGHTLGLRHNFKGSLVKGSSSIMEYATGDDELRNTPGTYDVAAIKYLYRLSDEQPKDAFCTDEDTRYDPDCTRFDYGSNPLEDFNAPTYQDFLGQFLSGASPSAPNNSLNNVLKYVRVGQTPEIRKRALEVALTGIAAPATASEKTQPARIDAMSRVVLSRLYLDAPALRGTFNLDPPASDAQLTALLHGQIKSILLNEDKLRTYASRRAMVDILKKQQTLAAYNILLATRTTISAAEAASPEEAALNRDLVARIDAATTPYFIK